MNRPSSRQDVQAAANTTCAHSWEALLRSLCSRLTTELSLGRTCFQTIGQLQLARACHPGRKEFLMPSAFHSRDSCGLATEMGLEMGAFPGRITHREDNAHLWKKMFPGMLGE